MAALMAVLSLLVHIKRRDLQAKCDFFLYFFIFFLISVLMGGLHKGFEVGEFATTWLKLIAFYYLITVAARTDFDGDTMYRWLVGTGVATSVLLIIQFIASGLFGIRILPYVSFLPLKELGGNGADFAAWQGGWTADHWRPSSIFMEPAHFSQYAVLPGIAALFGKGRFINEKYRKIYVLIIFSALFMSKSANGIFVALIILVIYFFRWAHARITANKFIIGVIAVIVACIFLVSTDFIRDAWERVASVAVRDRGTTGNQRLLQGLMVFLQLPFMEKLFGVGFGNILPYMTLNHITTNYSSVVSEYMNGFSVVLISSGLIGFIAYISIYAKWFIQNKSIAGRMALLVLAVFMCTSGMFFSIDLVLYFIFSRCEDRKARLEIGLRDHGGKCIA